MKIILQLVLSSCIFFGFSQYSEAQKSKSTPEKTTSKSTTENSNNNVDKKFVPILESTDRILILPSLEEQKIEKQPILYSATESPASLMGEYTPLPAASISTEYPAANQLGYFRLGVGNHRSFLGDLQLNLLRKTNHFIDVNYSHRSVFGDVVLQTGQVDQAYYADNDLQAHYRGFLGKAILDASLGEHFQFWNNYGKREAYGMDTLSMPSGQWSTDGHYSFGLSSMDLTNPLSWKVKSTGHLFRLGNGVASSSLLPAQPKGGTEKEFCINGGVNYELAERLHFGMDVKIRNFSYKAPASFDMDELNPTSYSTPTTEFADRSYFELEPNAVYFFKNWRFSAGLKLSIPSLVTESVRPNLVASATTSLSKTLVLKATLDGGSDPLSYREGLEMNPFLDPSIRLKSVWKPYDLSMNFDYRPTSNLRLNPSFGFNTSVDAPFFYNNLPIRAGINNSIGRYFSVQYMTSTQVYFSLDWKYSLGNKVAIMGGFNYNHYTNSSDIKSVDSLLAGSGRKAWYKPGITNHVRVDVSPLEKLTLYADDKLEGLRFAPTREDASTGSKASSCKNIGAINNLSLGANFNVSKGVGIFVHVNNLLDQRYEGYYGYPVHGFTAMVGGSVSL